MNRKRVASSPRVGRIDERRDWRRVTDGQPAEGGDSRQPLTVDLCPKGAADRAFVARVCLLAASLGNSFLPFADVTGRHTALDECRRLDQRADGPCRLAVCPRDQRSHRFLFRVITAMSTVLMSIQLQETASLAATSMLIMIVSRSHNYRRHSYARPNV